MERNVEQIRSLRLHAHHLDRKLPPAGMKEAAGACGLQNSPPGAWETALFNRLEGCTLEMLRKALWEEKSLLQAWSFRGAPVVFPTEERGVFLTPLAALPGEEPWIYTRGIQLALDYLGMSFCDLLPLVEQAAEHLDHCAVKSKESLDRVLAQQVREWLPPEKRELWDAPSMYGSPDRQTVGGAAVSFLLRPCAFRSLVVFGRREGQSPTFTSCRNWLGGDPPQSPDGQRQLVRKFLHCYGPSTQAAFGEWLGCSPRQAARLWKTAEDEMITVKAAGKSRFLLAEDAEILAFQGPPEEKLLLLGPHDPYLDIRDREVILEDRACQRLVWRTVSNPGVVLKGGRVAGIWNGKVRDGKLEFSTTLWENLSPRECRLLEELGEEYAVSRGLAFSVAKKKK